MKTMTDAIRAERPWLLQPKRPAWDSEPEESEEDRLQRLDAARTDAAIDRMKDEQ